MAVLMLSLVLLSLFHWGSCLYVLPTSSCAQTCIAGVSTGSDNLVCSDTQYFQSNTGITFRECSKCELQSLAYNGTLSDQYWSIFHMKFTQNYCLFESSPPTDSIRACADACAALRVTLSVNPIGVQPWKEQYDYCSDDTNSYTTNGPRCAQCLQAHTGSVVIGNFMELMIDLCQDRPYASKSASIQTAQDLYATATIPISTTLTASSTSLVTTSGATSSSPTSSTQTQASTTSNAAQISATTPSSQDNHTGLSTGAQAGIGVACGLAGIALLAAIIWFFAVRRRRRTGRSGSVSDNIHQNGYRHQPEQKELSDTSPSDAGQKSYYSELGERETRPELDAFGGGGGGSPHYHKSTSNIPPVEMAG